MSIPERSWWRRPWLIVFIAGHGLIAATFLLLGTISVAPWHLCHHHLAQRARAGEVQALALCHAYREAILNSWLNSSG